MIINIISMVIAIIISTPIILLKGFVVLKLWGWFVTTFNGVVISFWHAVGLCIFLAAFTIKNRDKTKDKDYQADEALKELGLQYKEMANTGKVLIMQLGAGYIVFLLSGLAK